MIHAELVTAARLTDFCHEASTNICLSPPSRLLNELSNLDLSSIYIDPFGEKCGPVILCKTSPLSGIRN